MLSDFCAYPVITKHPSILTQTGTYPPHAADEGLGCVGGWGGGGEERARLRESEREKERAGERREGQREDSGER